MNYLAFTIGPINKTLQKSFKTREIWLSSYFFSTIMEELINKTRNFGDIILPAKPTEKLKTGAGIYPDRLIAKISTTLQENDIIKSIINNAIESCSLKLHISINHLRNYLQINYINISDKDLASFEFSDKEGKKITSHIHRLNFLLDNKELNFQYHSSSESFFNSLFNYPARRKFVELAFGQARKDFPSILEISAKDKIENDKIELLYKDELNSEEAQKVSDAVNKLDTVHKYIAILRADGDNFGKVLAKISDNEDQLQLFSEKLVRFSEEASKLIADSGGTVIYIGGDDILCFTPVVFEKKTIFDLINELNAKFNNVFEDAVYKENKVAMSYGLSITYYKYPLNEALALSSDLLFNKAKKTALKKCICFKILQHSGQFREIMLSFGKQYDSFLTMLKSFEDKNEMLQSLTHQFVEDKAIISAVLDNNERLSGYFENYFPLQDSREEVHQFIEAVKLNTIDTYQHMIEYASTLKKEVRQDFNIEDETINQMNTICRTMKFININE